MGSCPTDSRGEMPMLPFSLTASQILGGLLMFTRIGGLMLTAPVLSSPRVPLSLRAGISILLTLLLLPVTALPEASAAGSMIVIGLMVLREVLTGLIIGYTANLLFSIVQIAGEMQDMQAGFAFAAIVDPTIGAHDAILGQLQTVLMWLIFFALNGHHLLLQGLADSFAAIPLGTGQWSDSLTTHMTGLVSMLVVTALRISAPVMGAVLLSDLAVGMLQRTAPQLNLLAIGFQIKVAVTVLTLLVALPFILMAQGQLVPMLGRQVMEITALLAGR